MQEKKPQKSMQTFDYANSLIVDMKSLSNNLKPISKNLYESNNRLLNELLLSNDEQIFSMIMKVLMHTLQIAQYKTLITHVLAILNKTIICIKTTQNVELSAQQKQSLKIILSSMVDILIAAVSQNRQVQETALRVLQTTFSLIDHSLIKFYSISMITRLFSICFQFCNGISILQNISVSALCAFVQALFQFGHPNEGFQVLNSFLQYLLSSKKFIWIKAKDVKGLIWDLITVCVKNFNANHIIALDHQKHTLELLVKMYEISVQNIFLKKNKHFYNSPQINDKQNNKNQTQTEEISNLIRFFKAYVYFSSSLSIQSFRVVDKQYVPFRSTIPKLIIVCDLQRNSRMFIFLQAICQLLLNQYVSHIQLKDMPLSLDKGIVFMEILSKIGEELCWCNETGIRVNWDYNQNYLDKVINEQPKVTDGDFVRLLKNTIIQLRMKFQRDQDLIKSKKVKRIEKQSSRQLINLPQNLRNSKKWEVFIKNVIRVIRYLSSLNFVNDEHEQDPTRKIILELQYWFLLCPASKAKNMVLQQLLITANVLNNRMQAIKVSQSVQIGSNILYGYYDDLDNMGLTIILKMMAGVKADWQDGKSFEELDQIYNLCKDIFTQEKLVKNQSNFIMTIQALVQCISSLIADIQEPKQKSQTNQSLQNAQNSLKRSHKMIDFLIQRLIVVVKNNLNQAASHWNFITGFLITLCINKNPKIKQQGIRAIGNIVSSFLKTELGQQIDSKKELDVLGLYEQLAKSKIQVRQTQLMLIDQLKMILPRIKQQPALIDGFRIVKILSQTQGKSNDVIASIHQLQQILIKQCLFRITQTKYLRMILQGFQTKSSDKNQQYRIINLLWSVADYFRIITPKQNIPSQYLQIWEVLFKSIWTVCQTTKQCETKQSAIHSLTQILAETLSLLPFDFVIVTISKYYHQMVLLLLGIHASSIIDSQKSPETAKVALKNYIKLFKKLISIQNKSQQDKKEISHNISQINNSITKFIRSHVQSKNCGSINLQFLYELSSFICSMNDDKGFQEYGVKKNLRQMFNSIQDLIIMCEQKEKSSQPNPKMDLKSHMFKKKLKPLLQKIKQTQDLQIKSQLVVQNKIQKLQN